MNRDCKITAALKRRQKTMFEEAASAGITAKVIYYDTGGDNGGIGVSTVGQWARGEAVMGLEMLNRLVGVIPPALLSMLLPDGFQIVRVPENVDHDAIADWAEGFSTRKLAAHRRDSECGELIGPTEDAELASHVVAFPGIAA